MRSWRLRPPERGTHEKGVEHNFLSDTPGTLGTCQSLPIARRKLHQMPDSLGPKSTMPIVPHTHRVSRAPNTCQNAQTPCGTLCRRHGPPATVEHTVTEADSATLLCRSLLLAPVVSSSPLCISSSFSRRDSRTCLVLQKALIGQHGVGFLRLLGEHRHPPVVSQRSDASLHVSPGGQPSNGLTQLGELVFLCLQLGCLLGSLPIFLVHLRPGLV